MNRWLRWAQQLRARHERAAQGRHAGPMVLLRAHDAAQGEAHRHLHAHVQVHLQPRFSARFFERHLATVVRAAAAKSPLERAPVPVAPQRIHYLHACAPAPAQSPASAAAPMAAARSPVRWPLPLAALVRTRSADPARRIAGPAAGAVIAATMSVPAASAPLARRQPVREEIMAPPTGAMLVTRQHAASAAVVAAASEQVRLQLEQARVVPATTAPPVNVDTLTGMVIEQIDRRMLAWRERMGRG